MHRPIDRQEIDRLVLEHLPDALRLALRLTRDPHLAEELVQEALLRVLRKWRSYRGESAFRTWLFSVLINAHRDQRRKKRTDEPLEHTPAAPQPGPNERAVANELAEKALAEIDRMPPRQREVASVCLGEGMSTRDAARALGMKENNVAVTLHNVRKRLASVIGSPEPKAR